VGPREDDASSCKERCLAHLLAYGQERRRKHAARRAPPFSPSASFRTIVKKSCQPNFPSNFFPPEFEIFFEVNEGSPARVCLKCSWNVLVMAPCHFARCAFNSDFRQSDLALCTLVCEATVESRLHATVPLVASNTGIFITATTTARMLKRFTDAAAVCAL
jgi:hypothetical protein